MAIPPDAAPPPEDGRAADRGAGGPDPADLHTPVLLDRCIELLAPALAPAAGVPAPPRWAVDGTLGMGGHAAALLALGPQVHLIGIDRDPQALALAARRLAPAAGRIRLVHAVFDELAAVVEAAGLRGVRAVLLDLGVSSLQLDVDERGFAYARDAVLDMRMDPASGPTAAQVVNSYSAKELARVFRTYGEERFAARIAAAIVAARAAAPLETTGQLAALVRDAIPAPARRTGGNPAKRVFQALRIEVNDELGALSRALPQVLQSLAPGGRAVVLSYHSLEDRLVKRAFAEASTTSTLPGLPVEPPPAPFRLLTRGAEGPGDGERERNPRSASVKLRAIERVA
jgi:16S rRNA (cytosine1402-N4)-methyltransferase